MKQYHRGDALVRDFDGLVYPSQVFQHPSEVVGDPDLSLNEKRAILAAWASDACAIEAAPGLRQSAGGRVVPFDEIMDALRALDREFSATQASRRTTPNSRKRQRGSGRSDQGAPLQ
jgi:hypothetical protein